jgi:hypothetical protein
LISSASFAASVNVPKQGWLIYGGNPSLGTTQLLAGVNQLWMAGPPIFNGQVGNDGACAVQVNLFFHVSNTLCHVVPCQELSMKQ